MRGLVPAGLVVGAVTATALSSVGPGALVPLKAVAAAASDVSVAFVVDFGSAGVVTACVKVPATDNGYGALTAFTQQENETPPTFNATGLLCSINGDPGSGCGMAVAGGYDYWSYWHGTSGTWVYATAGASGTVTNGDVEGWRFQDPGAANPNDPPPRAAPDYAAICGAIVPTTTVVSTSPSTPTSSPGSASTAPTATVATGVRAPVGGASATTRGTTTTSMTEVTSTATSSPPSSIAVPHPRTAAESVSTDRSHHRGTDDAVPLTIVVVVAVVSATVILRRRRRLRSP